MENNFERALADLGVTPFDADDFCSFSLQRDDQSSIVVNLFRDTNADLLRMSAYTSNIVPQSLSREFFVRFATAAMEPFRDNIGVGMTEESERLCVYYNVAMKDYKPGNSVIVLEALLRQVEKWDEILPFAAG